MINLRLLFEIVYIKLPYYIGSLTILKLLGAFIEKNLIFERAERAELAQFF